MLRPALLICCLLPACTTVQSVELVPRRVEVARTHPGTVSLEASGSGRSYGLGARRVRGEDLEEALRAAILESELFLGVAPEESGDWHLELSVTSLSNPEPSLDMEVEALLLWRLTDSTGVIRWEAPIRTSEESGPDDALDFGHRRRIATERALAANIARGLETIGALGL